MAGIVRYHKGGFAKAGCGMKVKRSLGIDVHSGVLIFLPRNPDLAGYVVDI